MARIDIGQKSRGISLMEVLTAIVILSIGIWALVAVFPTGQRVIRTAGVRQIATQWARDAMRDYVTDPTTVPFAIIPFDPSLLPAQPALSDPSLMTLVRKHYNFVWGEPLKLIQVSPLEWRGLVRFMPARLVAGPRDWRHLIGPTFRVYREVAYRQVSDPDPNTEFPDNPKADPGTSGDYTFVFNGPGDEIALPEPVGAALAGAYPRIIRVTYIPDTNPVQPIRGQLFLVSEDTRRIRLPIKALRIERLWEEYPIFNQERGAAFADGGIVLRRSRLVEPEPYDVPGARPDQTGPIKIDYLVDDPVAGGGHWLTERGPLVLRDDDGDGRSDEDPVDGEDNDGDGLLDEDPPAFYTNFGGITNVRVARADPKGIWGVPIPIALGSNLERGTLFLQETDDDGDGRLNEDPINGADDDGDGLVDEDPPLTAGTLVWVAYQTRDDWFVQVIKPPRDFQLQVDSSLPDGFRFETLRFYTISNGAVQFSPLLVGLTVRILWRDQNGELRDDFFQIGGMGTANLPAPPVAIEKVEGLSAMVRTSGRPLWASEPPRRRGDFVQLLFLFSAPTSLLTEGQI